MRVTKDLIAHLSDEDFHALQNGQSVAIPIDEEQRLVLNPPEQFTDS